MKRSLSFLTVALLGPIWRMPAWAGAGLTTIGVGGILAVVVILTPPAITPQPSLAFSQSNAYGYINQGMKPNGGTVGSMEFPSTPTNSFALYHEFMVGAAPGANSSLFGQNGTGNTLAILTALNAGPPTLTVETSTFGAPWWLPTVGAQLLSSGSPITFSPHGSGYNGGIYTWTAADGCPTANGAGAREPRGAAIPNGPGVAAYVVDPGLLCGENASGQAPRVNFASIPGVGANQATGTAASPAQTATSCVSNSPTSTQFTVTVHVAVAHGLNPGQSFTLAGFTPSSYNETYSALSGTSGTMLVGAYSNGTGTCPGAVTADGNVGAGSAGVITVTAPSTTSPYSLQTGTGIQFEPSQRVCGVFGEFGADSALPGAQFAKYTDITGTDLPGSPVVSPWLNQGAVNFTGYTILGAQSPTSPALTVTAMNPYSISSAKFSSTTGYATFTMSQNPGFIVGTEFAVSGAATSGGGSFNLTYVAVAGTSGTTIVGNPLSGPVGLPQVSSLTGSSNGSGGSMVGVIMPGMAVAGAQGLISPFGTFGSTGVGGVGTYGLTATQTTFTFTGSVNAPTAGFSTLIVTGTPTVALVVGQSITDGGVHITTPMVITALVSATGGAGTYTVSNANGVIASETMTSGGAIGSSGSPVNIYAAESYYYTVAPSGSAAGGGAVTARTQAALGDIMTVIGSKSSATTLLNGTNGTGWSGNIANVGMLEGAPFPMDATGHPSSSAFTSLCTKTTDFQSFASTYGGAWRSLYKLNDGGIWADHSLAELTGYTSGASGSTATLNVSSTQFGSTSSLAANSVISGVGLCANSVCPTVTSGSGSTYALNFGSATAQNVGSVGSPAPMAAGLYQPAAPLASQQVTASISGSTLTVTAAVGSSTSTFTGVFSGAQATGNLTTSSPTGTIAIGQCIWDGGANITPQYPLCITGGSGSAWTVNGGTSAFNFYPAIASETMYATNVAIVPGTYVMGAGITTPVLVKGYGTLTPCATTGFPMCGTYTIDNPGGLSVSSETMTLSGVTEGGAIAPGAALTVANPGTGATYPVTNWSAMTGVMSFNGKYSTGLLVGTPSHVQAQISATPGGPALSGCTPCAWTNVSGESISGGLWSGSVVNIPAGGPYWVSFRAANGISYATLPNAVFVGANVAGFGEGNAVDQVSGTAFASNQTYFQGFSTIVGFQVGGMPGPDNESAAYMPGPAYLNNWAPSHPGQLLVDRYGVIPSSAASLNDGAGQQVSNASALLGGAPVGFVNMYKNGTGFQNEFYGGVTQTQTIGVGDGSTATFSSGMGFGGSVGSALASTMTGSISGNTMTVAAPGPGLYEFINIGNGVSCGTCAAGTVITGFGTAVGSAGTYIISPSQTVTSTTLTITHNNLDFNGAWGYGATVTGTVSGGVLTVSAVQNGVMAPLLTISDGTNNATLTACLTNCSLMGSGQATSTWRLSSSALNGDTIATTFSVAPSGGALWPSLTIEPSQIPVQTAGPTAIGGEPLIQAGTFQVLVNGTAVCQDTSTFAYNTQVGNCVGAGVSSAWVNYLTGGFSVTFSSPPASNATIVAKWTNIMSSNSSGGNEQLDWVGNTAPTSGVLASVAAKTGGINAYLNGQQCGGGWPDAMLGAARQLDYLFGTRMAGIHGGMTGQPMLTTGQWRGMGTQAVMGYFSFTGNLDCEEYDEDAGRNSVFSGTIGSASGSGPWTAVLTLTAAATGPMWEGEVVECNPYSATCALPLGTEIVSIASGAWGASGSTYNVTSDQSAFTAAASAGTIAMHNAMWYPPGTGAYVGPYVDLSMQNGFGGGYAVETGGGMNGALRYGHRAGVEIGAALSGHPEHGSDPTLDRTTFLGCDGAAATSPCLDIGNTYAASHAATWSGSTFTVSGGLSAGSRPFVPGMALSCSGCNSGLVALAVSSPPTQSTATSAGQIGQTFTITASGAIGGGGSGALTGGCSGTSGTGSNCIDFKFDINTTGTYGTTAALVTCGVNNLEGTNTNLPTAGPYIYPNGTCVPTGIGALARGFRIGSYQLTDIQAASTAGLGSAYDFGMDPGVYVANGPAGVIVQNEAFTCNIVAATIVQCVKGPSYSHGAFSSIGQWSSGATYASYGDPNNAFSFMTGIVGYPGGQSFPFTAGSGYTTPAGVTDFVTGGVCALNTTGGTTPQAPAMGFNLSGGAIINAYPTILGSSVFSTCSFPVSFTFAGVISGYNGTAHTANLAVTGITTGTGPGTIVPGEILTGPSFTGYATVVSGPFNGLNGTYVISTMNSNITGSLAAETMTSGPTGGSGAAITTPPLGWSTGVSTPEGVGAIQTNDADNNLTGTALYDNSGVSGNPLAGKFALPQGGLESPGLPVHPFGMRRGTGVSG